MEVESLGVLVIFAIVYLGYKLLKEKFEKPLPKGSHKDWDAYWADIREDKMTMMEIIKKEERGGYMTTKPKPTPWYELPPETIVDVERYEFDKKKWGEAMAESWRKSGAYRTVVKTNYKFGDKEK